MNYSYFKSLLKSNMYIYLHMFNTFYRHVPVDHSLYQTNSLQQKLSKIETLRLAINYIAALKQILDKGQPMSLHTFWTKLSVGLSQPTSHLIAASLHLYHQSSVSTWKQVTSLSHNLIRSYSLYFYQFQTLLENEKLKQH